MIRLIAAIDQKRGLSRNGQIPWDIPQDKARFRQLTHDANVLIGRVTYGSISNSIGKNKYIISHRKINPTPGAVLVSDLDKFIKGFNKDLWVIGGAATYSETIKYADELYLTLIDADFNCDKFFPEYTNFQLKKTEGPFIKNGLSFSYQLLTRL